jgi:outer membrane protein assembly factor BamB
MKTNIIIRKIRISILPVSFFSLIISSYSYCLAQKFDGIKELESRNEFLKLTDGVKQVWQTQSIDEEIDQIIPFNDNKILLKTIHTKDYHIDYNYSNISMVNMDDGTIDWTFSTLDIEQKRQNIITTIPVILIFAVSDKEDEKSGLYAISPSDGKLLWNYPITGSATYIISNDAKSLFLSIKEKESFIIEDISLENGEIIWKNNTAVVSDKNLNSPLLFDGKDLYVISCETVIALNKNDGKLIWQNNLRKNILSYFQSGGSLWLYNYHQILNLDLKNGKIQSDFLIPDKFISVIALYNDLLFASVYDSTRQVQEIACYNIKNQKANWILPIGSSLKSAIYNENDKLFFTTEKAFYKIDINSGTVIANIMFADTNQAKTFAFDIIEKREENYLIARENSISIISEKEKNTNLYVPFGISGGFTPTYMQNKLNEMSIASLIVPEKIKSTYNTVDLYTDRTFSNLARQNQNWVNVNTASTLASNSNASHSERVSALNSRELAANGSYNSGRMDAYSQLVGSYGQLGKSIGNLLAFYSVQITKKAFIHILDYMEEKIKASLSYQTECISGNFYLRPYFENGWRLAVIDINNIGYASIPMIPDLPPLRYSFTGSVVYSVLNAGDKHYILVKGLKPLPREVTAVYKFKYGDMDNSKLYDWTLPNPSLICYDITHIKTDNKYPQLKSITLNANTIDMELIEAAFFNDINKVEELVENGANVNANDKFGHTALMHACQIVNKKMVKILLQAGANPKTEDPEGLDAYDYVSMEFSNNLKDAVNIWGQLKKAKAAFN